MSLYSAKNSFFTAGVTDLGDISCLVDSEEEEEEEEVEEKEPEKEPSPPIALEIGPEDSQDPEAHLEALDTILNCAALQRSGDDGAEIAALLAQARTLLLDNTVTVILATLRHLHASTLKLPAFWHCVRSPRELATWLGLFDVILYCWGGRQGVGDVTTFVERHVRGFTEELRHLRALYDFSEEELANGGAEASACLATVKTTLRPAHWTLVAPLKKFRPALDRPWRVLTAALRLCGLLDSSVDLSGSLVPLSVMKETLRGLTFAHLDRLADFEALAVCPDARALLRSAWLRSALFEPSAVAAADVSGLPASWALVPGLAGDFVRYLLAVERLSRLRERLSLDEAKLRSEIADRLLNLGAGQMAALRKHREWAHLPQDAKEALDQRREEMSARCSVTSGSDAPSPSGGPPSASVAFQVGLEVPKPIHWSLTNVKSPMTDFL